MGVAAAAHYIVNVGGKPCPFVLCSLKYDQRLTVVSNYSNSGGPERILQHWRELLLRVRCMLHGLLRSCLLLLSVSMPPGVCYDTVLISPSETKQKTLEEIAAAFGDEVVKVDTYQGGRPEPAAEGKAFPELEHVEGKRSV